jgi:hypothetical protein
MKTIKVEQFSIDRSLGYLIQNSTSDSTQEILSYFYSIARFVVSEVAPKTKSSWMSKDIVLFYKDTPISYKMRVSAPSANNDHWDCISTRIDVSYPSDSEHFQVSQLMDSIVESGLGLSDENNLPPFEKPELKTPRCLKPVRIAQSGQKHKAST